MALITDHIQILGKLEENALATTKWVTGEKLAWLGHCVQEPAVKETNHRLFPNIAQPASRRQQCKMVTMLTGKSPDNHSLPRC